MTEFLAGIIVGLSAALGIVNRAASKHYGPCVARRCLRCKVAEKLLWIA